ncbi:MAG: HAD-IA family hydrolase [Nocardioidaceae bacterium]
MGLRDHRLLTFDVVGTCIDFEAGVAEAVAALARRSGAAVPDRATVLEAFGRAEERQQQETPEMAFTQMLEPIYRDVARELDLPEEAGNAPGLKESIPFWPAFPDAVDALRRLRTRFRLVALTNSDRWGLEQMVATLQHPFDDGVTAEDVGVNKPSPRVFDYCRGRQSAHGYQLANILHVAQSQYHDIGVAKSLGYQVCWIERRSVQAGWGATPAPSQMATPDYHFTSLSELADAAGV